VVYFLSAAAAVFLGVGWVIQQRVATGSASARSEGLLSWSVLVSLISSWQWWAGVATMTIGQSLSAWALQFGPVSSVEPVLVSFLLVAFVVSARSAHERARWQELLGPVILIVSLTVFLAVSSPSANRHADPSWPDISTATAAAFAIAAVIAIIGRASRRRLATKTALAVESAALAAAAGIMYALQDVATRGAIVATHHHNLVGLLLLTMWPWVLLAAATAGVLLSQAAFRAERLDYALPPTAAAQPIAGVILGVTLLGDDLSASGISLAVESLCLVTMLGAVILIGRTPALKPQHEPVRAQRPVSGHRVERG
jgi:drug/metabolite transporter (DMT)-like permease